MGLRLKAQKGPRRAPHPWSPRAGYLTSEPSRLPGLTWAGQTLSSPVPPLWEGPSCLPLLISPVSLLWPQGPTRPGGGLGSQEAPRARESGAVALCFSPTPPRWLLPPASPDLPSLPPMPPGPTHSGGGFGGGYQPGSSAGSPGRVGLVITLHSHSSWRAPPHYLS